MNKKERIEKASTQIIAAIIASPKHLNHPLVDRKINPINYSIDVAEQLIEEMDNRYPDNDYPDDLDSPPT